jgi:NAD(P)-dependent dehydrogenase (short-subunit alcohol dehydrogenase family)
MDQKIAIVTGAGQGIGRAIAIALAQNGSIPVIADINAHTASKVAEEINSLDVPAVSLNVDVSRVPEIENMVKQVVDKFGTVDILVNNAGILHATQIEDITEEEWDRMMAVNLKSVFFASQQVLPYMKKKRWGRIINMSSLAGRMGGYGNGVGYAATKAGIVGLSMSMARRVAPFNITVNAIAPGTTESEILKSFTPERIAELKKMVPLGRLGKPGDIAALCAFLASEQAGFITGAVIDINGGMFMG